MGRLQSLKPRVGSVPSRLATVTPGSWRADKGGSSTARGYGYRWQKARLEHLRLHPLCVYCEESGTVTAAAVVDHKVPHRGDQALFWNQANWQSLCKACHDGRKAREEGRGAAPGPPSDRRA